MADFLLALADFDRKKLWRELGHASLFYYLHRELRLSKGAAQNRKTAAELIQAFPEVEAALRAGELCLTTVNELAKVLTPENRAEVLPRFFGLSRREAEAVAMSLRPAEVVPTRDVITAFRPAAQALRAVMAAALPAPSPESPALPVHPDEPVLVHLDEPTAPVMVAASRSLPPPPPPRESVERLDAEVARVHVTVSRRFLEKLEAATDALGHACPGGSAAEILERGLDLILAQHAKRRGLVEKPRKGRGGSRRDTIPAEVKREVWRRAGGQCEWRFESGERCDCRRRLEYDHIEPLALGGASTMDNVRLACRPHNLLAARQVFGDAVMDRYRAVGR
ncbi:HNH endonuclease [Anaeromyxobacter sp. Fw109-5]|nr:HNH endonuclease [Anaeromyxobacter sp. Fw109-5]